MDSISFEVPGHPVSWKRTRGAGNARYTDPKQRNYMQSLRMAAQQAAAGRKWDCATCAISLSVMVFQRGPAGDADNYAKIVGDALQQRMVRKRVVQPPVLWLDDRQIKMLHVEVHHVESREEERMVVYVTARLVPLCMDPDELTGAVHDV